MRTRILLALTLLSGICLSLFCWTPRASAAGAAPRDAARSIVSQTLEAYGSPIDAGEINRAVESALEEGVKPEDVRAVAVGAARADRKPSETARLVGLIADFRLSGLPAAPAVSIVLEGISIEASLESIEGALGKAKRNIAFSVSLASRHRSGNKRGEKPDDLVVKAVSLALEAGFDESSLERVSDAAINTGNDPDYFFACLKSLLELGGAPLQREEIAGLVTLAAQKRFSAKDLSRLTGLVESKLAEERPEKGEGRTGSESGPSRSDTALAAILEEMKKSRRPSDFFAALGYGPQNGQGKSQAGSASASGSSPAGSAGGSQAGSGGGGSQGGGGSGAHPGGSGGGRR